MLTRFWEEESKRNFCKKSSKFPKSERLILEESLNGDLCDEESDLDSLEENEEKPPPSSAVTAPSEEMDEEALPLQEHF